MSANLLILEAFDALPPASRRSQLARGVLRDAIAQHEAQANAIAVCWRHACKVGDEEAKADLNRRWLDELFLVARYRAALSSVSGDSA